MSNAYVRSATFTDNKLTFRVDVRDFKTNTGSVEISGQAVQDGGAFINIYAIKQVPTDEKADPYVDVTVTVPPDEFRKDQYVTVFMRVSVVWATVLSTQPPSSAALSAGQPADSSTTWANVVTVGGLNGAPPPSPWGG